VTGSHGIQLHFKHLPRFNAALKEIETAALAASAGLLSEAAHMTELRAKKKAGEGGRHKAGTPTPATPGSGPAVISGSLRRSIHVQGPYRKGWNVLEVMVGPSMIYGRRVELEYNYPYMKPAYEDVKKLLPRLERKWWGRAMKGKL
jgi:hypothetical protein